MRLLVFLMCVCVCVCVCMFLGHLLRREDWRVVSLNCSSPSLQMKYDSNKQQSRPLLPTVHKADVHLNSDRDGLIERSPMKII